MSPSYWLTCRYLTSFHATSYTYVILVRWVSHVSNKKYLYYYTDSWQNQHQTNEYLTTHKKIFHLDAWLQKKIIFTQENEKHFILLALHAIHYVYKVPWSYPYLRLSFTDHGTCGPRVPSRIRYCTLLTKG